MLREIFEQPQALCATVEHNLRDGNLNAEIFRDAAEAFRGRERLVIAASGSSRYAGLAATLRHYLMGEAPAKIPVWRMIATPLADLEQRAQQWAKLAGGKVVDGETMVGGGSLPGGSLPTRLVALAGGKTTVKKLAETLRTGAVPVVGRISDDALLLDPRTVLPEEDTLMETALESLSVK